MSTNKQALREMAERAASDSCGYDRDEFNDAITPGVVLALLDELESAEARIAELEAREEALRPVGVMSEKAFHRLERTDARFIALWPRPGIYLPRKRPEDGVIVYARTAGITVKGE